MWDDASDCKVFQDAIAVKLSLQTGKGVIQISGGEFVHFSKTPKWR